MLSEKQNFELTHVGPDAAGAAAAETLHDSRIRKIGRRLSQHAGTVRGGFGVKSDV